MCMWKNKKIFQKVSSWPSYRWVFETDAEGQKLFLNFKTTIMDLLGQIKDPFLVPYLTVWRRMEQACTDTSPDHSSRLADFAAQGLSQPEAMSLYSTALGEFFSHKLLL